MQPMRLLRIPHPFAHPDFLYELKLDGFGGLATIEGSSGASIHEMAIGSSDGTRSPQRSQNRLNARARSLMGRLCVSRPMRPRTFDTYEAAIRSHIEPYIGNKPLATFTPQHAQAWLSELKAAGVSIGRQRYARVVLRAALNTAIRCRFANVNAAALIDAPRTIARELQTLTPDQAKQLLAAVDNHSLQGFVTVALACGLRLGEALAELERRQFGRGIAEGASGVAARWR